MMHNKSVLVTGGTRGLGKAIAARLADEGARVWATSRFAPKDLPLRAPAAGEIEKIHLNVDHEDSVHHVFQTIQTLSGRLDVVVNNAGIGLFKPLVETTLEEWERVLRTNLTGVFLCAKEAFRLMAAQGGGRIINIGSVSAYVPIVENGAYGTSKFGLHGLSQILNEEGKALGVRVSIIHPGSIQTEMAVRPGHLQEDMLTPDDVAQSVADIARRPLSVRIDEVRIVPPKGVL